MYEEAHDAHIEVGLVELFDDDGYEGDAEAAPAA